MNWSIQDSGAFYVCRFQANQCRIPYFHTTFGSKLDPQGCPKFQHVPTCSNLLLQHLQQCRALLGRSLRQLLPLRDVVLLQQDPRRGAGDSQVSCKLCGHLLRLQQVAIVAELQHHGFFEAESGAEEAKENLWLSL